MSANEKEKQLNEETVKQFEETIKRLQEMMDNPRTSEASKKKCARLIKKIQNDIVKIREGPKPTKYCKFCGQLYDPWWTMIHGDKHLLQSVVRYNEKTGELLKRPYIDDRAFSLFGSGRKR